MQSQQTRQQPECSFGELGETILLQMEVSEMRQPLECLGTQWSEVIFWEVEVDQTLHTIESPIFYLMDLAALQVNGNQFCGAWETVCRDVVEMVVPQVQQACVRWKTRRDLGEAFVFTRWVVVLSLQNTRVNDNSVFVFLVLLYTIIVFVDFLHSHLFLYFLLLPFLSLFLMFYFNNISITF